MDDNGFNKADAADFFLPALAAVTAALAAVVWEFAPTEDGWQEALGHLETWGAIVATVASLGLALVTGKRSLTTRAEARGAMKSFSNSLTGASDAVSELMQSKRLGADCDRFMDSMLGEATRLMPIRNCRATLYTLEGDERSEGGAQYLQRVGRSKGRPDNARRRFTPDTAHGKAIIEIVEEGKARYVATHRAPSIPLDRDEEAQWRSFCVVPVHSRDRVWGALFLDSDKLNDFTDDQKSVSRSIARFLEVGVQLLESAARDVQPELRDAMVLLRGVAHADVRGDSYDAENREGQDDGES
ncbi:hypothetical protein CBF90_05840 [Microbacterium sp. AISO3]|uniref:GAF domain-containing protein n=1 Tax=Microbacterium sp. AISO3 TaxID=2002831 RepID=UPI000B4D4ACD|nr:GAF domain-containing protein [Microbacterium sp. AISO3]OWP22433.1 hypothetical protein CBF90_05840 [Microbacterium sp. AISO3]